MLWLRPELVPDFAPFRGAQTVDGETKRDSHEPAAETVAVAQAIELAIGAHQRFLRDIFRVGRVTQNAACDAVGEGATFGEALLELAPRVSLGCFVLQLIPDRATWLDQNQLLHKSSSASATRSTS